MIRLGKLGYSSITLTDLTNTLPVSLVLESNLENNIQVKTGTKYTPDFSKNGNGVIITPSLFLGQEEIRLENNLVKPEKENDSGYIYYEIGNTRYQYSETPEENKNYVDEMGCLHIIENLDSNITIEAYIEDFKVVAHDYEVSLVTATNPVSILLLEEGTSNYQAVIECEGGREHFEDTNSKNITMTATLYKGNEILNYKKLADGSIEKVAGFIYSWERLSDGDSLPDGLDFQFVVKRANTVNREYYTCTITEEATGLSYTASQFIYDFTDEYNCSINYDRAPVLTDTETEITLEAIVFKRDINISADEDYNLSYAWYAADENGSEYTILERNKSSILKIDNSSSIPRYKDFVLYCKVFHTDETNNTYQIAGATLLIHYTVDYSVKVSPQTIFIPSSSRGVFQGKNEDGFGYYEFSFQILDTAGNPMVYSESEALPGGNFDDNSSIYFTSEEEGKWNFKGTLKLDLSEENDLWVESNNMSSKIYEFNYTFLGQVYTEEITVVKSFAGEQGVPAYTVALSNDFHAFSGGEGRADFNQRVELDFSAFFGDKPLEITKVFLTNDANKEDIDERKKISQGLYIERIKGAEGINERKYILSTATSGDSSNFLTENGTIGFSVVVSEEGVGEKTFYKSFQYIINFNSRSYYLMTNANTIKYNSNGKYSINQVSISAFYRDINGAAQKYNSGRIRYSFNNGENWTTGSLGETVINLEDGKFYNSIIVELYSAKENNWDSSLLLDRETINILVSLEGIQIGAENLIPWSKTLSTEENRWKCYPDGSYFSFDSEEDFNVVLFNGKNDKILKFFSPKIPLEKNYIDKMFSFSCLIFSEAWANLKQSIDIGIEIYNQEYDSNGNLNIINSSFEIIGSIFSNENLSTINFQEGRKNSLWQKIYKTFIFNESLFSNLGSTKLDEYTDFSIIFILNSSGSFKIKKPKLELGSFPTDWSINFKDNEILINDIEKQLNEFIGKYDEDIVKLSDDKLTLSSGGKTTYLSVIKDVNDSSIKNSSTSMIPVTITDPDGNKYSFLNLEEFKEYLKELNENNASQIRNYSTTLIDENLKEYRSSISIHPATVDEPIGYISISASYFKNNEKKYLEALKLTSNKLSFIVDEKETAYMSNNKFYIPHGQITDSLVIGSDKRNLKVDSHLKIFTSDNGVGFIWEEINNV